MAASSISLLFSRKVQCLPAAFLVLGTMGALDGSTSSPSVSLRAICLACQASLSLFIVAHVALLFLFSCSPRDEQGSILAFCSVGVCNLLGFLPLAIAGLLHTATASAALHHHRPYEAQSSSLNLLSSDLTLHTLDPSKLHPLISSYR